MWRFVRAKEYQRGFDLTAVAVDSKEDCNSFREAISSHVQLQLGLNPETDEKELLEEIDSHYPLELSRV